jgi:uncharacterized protein YdhG (YjbR/CyaY superfamily)
VAKAKPAKKASKVFTEAERSAMVERAREQKALRADELDGEGEVLAKIAEMTAADRSLAERLHSIIKSSAPTLSPRTWYGMPAYAKNGKIVCHIQPAQKFKTRYATIGFSDAAHLDDGALWPVAFALASLSAAEETKIRALLKKAVG